LVGGAVAAWPMAARAQQPDERVRVLQARILRDQAEAVAAMIAQFIKEMESQISWTTQLPWSVGTMDQRRFDALRLLRAVPAISELSFLDASGTEQLKVSRLAMDVIGSKTDLSQDPKFTEAVAHKVYYGPVYFRREVGNGPYMTLALAGTRRESGVSVGEVSLWLLWDVAWEIARIKLGGHSVVYVLDAQNRVIAHSDIYARGFDNQAILNKQHFDPALLQRDFSNLSQVLAARSASSDLAASEPISYGLCPATDSTPEPETPAVCVRSRDQGVSNLAQWRAAHAASSSATVQVAQDINGREVFTAFAAVAGVGWLVFVELPIEETGALAQ
jgi:hypothetical protein